MGTHCSAVGASMVVDGLCHSIFDNPGFIEWKALV